MTPAEKKASELAYNYSEEIPELETSEFTGEGVYRIKDIEKSFIAGFRAALELAEVKELVELLERSLEVRDFEAPEDAGIKELGERIGFGALLDSAVKGWHESAKEKGYPPGGAFTLGHCHATVESALTAWRSFRGEK